MGTLSKVTMTNRTVINFLMCCKKLAGMYTTVQKSFSAGFSYRLTASRCVSISSQGCPANPLKGEYYQKEKEVNGAFFSLLWTAEYWKQLYWKGVQKIIWRLIVTVGLLCDKSQEPGFRILSRASKSAAVPS